jgi:hypothetical protein
MYFTQTCAHIMLLKLPALHKAPLFYTNIFTLYALYFRSFILITCILHKHVRILCSLSSLYYIKHLYFTQTCAQIMHLKFPLLH